MLDEAGEVPLSGWMTRTWACMGLVMLPSWGQGAGRALQGHHHPLKPAGIDANTGSLMPGQQSPADPAGPARRHAGGRRDALNPFPTMDNSVRSCPVVP